MIFRTEKTKKQCCEDWSKCKTGEENDCLKWVKVYKLTESPPWKRTCQCNYGTTVDKFEKKTENNKGTKELYVVKYSDAQKESF